MSDQSYPFADIVALDAPIEEDEVFLFEFDNFTVRFSKNDKAWTVELPDETFDEMDEEVAIVLESPDQPFSEETQLFLKTDFGIEFSKEDLDRLKECVANQGSES